METLQQENPAMMNRSGRRAWAKRNKTSMPKGRQDSSKTTHKQVFVKTTRKSRAGVKYVVYKKLIVKI